MVTVIDLTDIPTSDDEGPQNSTEVPNCSIWRSTEREALDQVWTVKVENVRAEHIWYFMFSKDSKEHYKELINGSKITNIGFSVNPYFDRALFAGEKIKKGDFITLYHGIRLPYEICDALQKQGRPPNFALSIPNGVVIDALGYPYGAGMANHSCSPNTSLEFGFLRGNEHAPYAYLTALVDIEIGDELECCYRYIDHLTKARLDAIIRSGRFIRCRCLKPNCRQVFCEIDTSKT